MRIVGEQAARPKSQVLLDFTAFDMARDVALFGASLKPRMRKRGRPVDQRCAACRDEVAAPPVWVVLVAKAVADDGDQLLSIPGVLEGTVKPDYNRMIQTAAKQALKKMLFPSVLALCIPILRPIRFRRRYRARARRTRGGCRRSRSRT